ncbi:MAG TPA: PA domain-containing protein [Thermoanaerobaculia bacterium]|jgi:hypothetical protein
MKRTLVLALTLVASLNAFGKGKIVIVNKDRPGTGFNDPTPAVPVGGNPGTTLGSQRLNVFEYAAAKWSAVLDIDIDVVAQATFAPIGTCSATEAVLGQAGPVNWQRDFTSAPRAGIWYPIALANQFAGRDINGGAAEINAQFNGAVDTASCLGDSDWYYGFDGENGNDVDLYHVVLHELAHGLGVSGAVRSPAFRDERPAITDVHTLDLTTGRRWDQMSEAERSVSYLNTSNLVWDGDVVRQHANWYLRPVTMLSVSEPAVIARQYDIGTAAGFGAPITTATMSGKVVRVADAMNTDGPTATDGCTAFTNAGAIAGNVALVDRGTCTYVVKARNAQAAGATGLIVADHTRTTCQPPSMGGEATDITIPVVTIGANEGDLLKAQLTANVNVQAALRTDANQLAGASKEGYVRLYAPCTEEPGSSTHHWDVVATPNLLMEPFINSDLNAGVDLTLWQLLDIGWKMPPHSGRGAGRR